MAILSHVTLQIVSVNPPQKLLSPLYGWFSGDFCLTFTLQDFIGRMKQTLL